MEQFQCHDDLFRECWSEEDRMKSWCRLSCCVWTIVALSGLPAFAQRHVWQDEGLDYRRTVEVAADAPLPAILVCEFFAHGALPDSQSEVTGYGHRDPVPVRVLQRGPGDFCRVALQTAEGQRRYYLYYGGAPRDKTAAMPWSSPRGLLLETRKWRPCDLNRLEGVQQAFAAAESLGSDYVKQVFHRHNPFVPSAGPFLSRYLGQLDVPADGKYSFYTSSQDCSFLLIDGRTVIAAPGQHPPDGQARRHAELQLSKGKHDFEYWHAASGNEACMVAAWKPPGGEKPELIPPAALGFGDLLHVTPSQLEHRADRQTADFVAAILGDCPLNDSEQWMVRAQFLNTTDAVFRDGARFHWQFGDGQTSQEASPVHIYLHPGPYQVTLSVKRGTKTLQVSNLVEIGRPILLAGQKSTEDQLTDYLPLVADYDPLTLDAEGLVQLAKAYLESDDPQGAVKVGSVAFAATATKQNDAARWELAQLLGPVLRDRLHDPQAALNLWRSAGKLISRRDWRAQCAVEAADICLHDLLQSAEAAPFLDFARQRLSDAQGETAARLHLVWGDWNARQGNAAEARAAYGQAERMRVVQRRTAEANAWRGAYSRSVEAFLRDGQLNRARDELRGWQRDFPLDKIEGYQATLWARYWLAAGKPDQAIAVANDLLAVNPGSSYADRLLMLAADCHSRQGRPERARAVWQSLLTDYPGSPLVTEARDKLAADPPTASPDTPPTEGSESPSKSTR
jgi:TolA-binding protein